MILGLVGVAPPAGAINAVAVPAYWWAIPADEPVAAPYPVTSWTGAAPMPLIAVAYVLIGLWLVPWLTRMQVNWACWLP